MQLPHEILLCILESASSFYTCNEFLKLRLTSYLFDEEVLSILLNKPYDFSLISGRVRLILAAWDTVPAGLRRAYLRARVKKHGAEPNLFAHLFIPVFESQLKKLGIPERDYVTRQEKLREWTSLCMHEHWEDSWVVIHACWPMFSRKLSHYYDHTLSDEPEKRIENDRKFLDICCAIVADNEDGLLDAFAGFRSGVDDLNYCFGTTLLGFAVKHASPGMLQVLLRSIRQTSRKHLYKYLSIAVSEAQLPERIVRILLNRLTSESDPTRGKSSIRKDTARTIITRDLLFKAIENDDAPVFEAIFRWIATFAEFPNKQAIVESCFKLAHSSKKRKSLRESQRKPLCLPPAPTHRAITSQSILNIVPAHHFGTAYHHRLITKCSVYVPQQRSMKPYYWFDVNEANYAYPQGSVSDYGPYTTNGFDVHARVFGTRDPLFRAVLERRLDWVDWLLWSGVHPGYEDDEGMGLLDVAWSVGKRKEVAELVYAYGWRFREWKWVRCDG